MGVSGRPSIQSVQRSLIIGILAGVLFGCLLGTIFGTYYAWRVDPAVYSSGAFPSEMTGNYQDHYVATVVDSYIVNRQVTLAQERLKTFTPAAKVQILGKRSTDFVANGQAVEAQLVNELAVNLKAAENWNDDVVKNEIAKLTNTYQGDSARAQALNTFSAQLLGAVPAVSQPPSEAAQQVEAPPPAQEEPSGGLSLRTVLGCLLLLIVIVALVLLVGRWQFNRSRSKPKPQIEWEGEGPPPLKIWSGSYTLGQNNYDEFFTIETNDGDFLGESGMGIMKAVPGTDPKQVTAFDVGLFDKTDITTLSRVVMSQDTFQNDVELRNNIESNPQAEAILAEPGKEFTLETSALRVVAKIDELAYGGGGSQYFEKLKVSLHVFLREGADLRIGSMDVPDEFQA